MKISKVIYNNEHYDAIEVSFRDHKLVWVGYHSHLLITLMEENWKYDKLIDNLTDQWVNESYYAIFQLMQVAPSPMVKKMQSIVRMYIIEMVFEFKLIMQNNQRMN